VLAGEVDATAMGGVFTMPVEAMSTSELRDLAEAQADTYFKREWTKEQFRDYLDELVRSIAQHERGPVMSG